MSLVLCCGRRTSPADRERGHGEVTTNARSAILPQVLAVVDGRGGGRRGSNTADGTNFAAPAAMPRSFFRWRRFSLRSLLIAVTALAVWLGGQSNLAKRQRKTVQDISNMGGVVAYD